MELETKHLKDLMPDIPWFGISDGAPDIQAWLESHCDVVTLDFTTSANTSTKPNKPLAAAKRNNKAG